VTRAHQPGSEPMDIPEVIPNPVVVPKQAPTPSEPVPPRPIKIPEKAPAGHYLCPAVTSNEWPQQHGREPTRSLMTPAG
jgi:hypothetical protein